MVSLALMKVRAKVAAKEYSRGLFSERPPMNGLPFRFTTNTLTCTRTHRTSRVTINRRFFLHPFLGLIL